MGAAFTNRLASELSPYLRQHAHNPVDWRPWGEEAFAAARAEQKPIFLSIGYSTCHWCHVMARESFEDPAVAARLNRDFIPVKVDREERPEVDRLYMTYIQAATGQGGWPMSVWLTPELKPFYGGTYFPPDDRWGRPGFGTVLDVLARTWATDRPRLVAEAEQAVAGLRQLAAPAAAGQQGDGADDWAAPAGRAFERCFEQLYGAFDAVHGGFGGPPKFPRASVFNFLARVAALQGADSEAGAAALRLVTVTLDRMAAGGIHDHVGGGFHRYSVDEEWFVPHFEKMLYDQAQLAGCYLEARQATGDEHYAEVARDILDYALRDLGSPTGGFCSAEDADSEIPEAGGGNPEEIGRHAEGAFYLWSKTELEGLLGDDATLFCAHFDVEDQGNVPVERDPQGEFRGRNLLRRRRSLVETAAQFGIEATEAGGRLAACRERLRAVRARRPRPARDDKILTAWNGLMISALAKASQVLGDRDYCRHAARTAEFLRRELYDESTGLLYRSHREGRNGIAGSAEDYACLVQGLLDLYEAGFDDRWLRWADQLQTKMDDLFGDDAGGYYNSPADAAAIIVRLKEDYDGAEPAASSVAAMNLHRLAWMLGDGEGADAPGRTAAEAPYLLSRRERARRCIAVFRSRWEAAPHTLPQLLCSLELALQPPRTVVLAGDPGSAAFGALTAVLHERLRPRRALLAVHQGSEWLMKRRPHLADMTHPAGGAAAYLCEDLACQPPVSDPEELRRLLAG